MMIWGIHVHVGVDDVNKVFPIINALAAYLPHLQALSASSPFWAGERTGYASNRALVFQQLPDRRAALAARRTGASSRATSTTWSRTGVMEDATEVRWDIRPAPRWGTIEVRACDGMSTLPELAAVAALVQVLVEHFSRELDEGRELVTIQPWFVRENKWRAARYGLDARIIVDRDGTQVPVTEHLRETLDEIGDIADELKCARELAGIETILDRGCELRAPARWWRMPPTATCAKSCATSSASSAPARRCATTSRRSGTDPAGTPQGDRPAHRTRLRRAQRRPVTARRHVLARRGARSGDFVSTGDSAVKRPTSVRSPDLEPSEGERMLQPEASSPPACIARPAAVHPTPSRPSRVSRHEIR